MVDSLKKLYPFTSHFYLEPHFENFENRIHYLDEGAGDPILCLHGNPTWSFYFRNLVKEFRGTHRVVVPDHLGCGFSGRPTDFSYTLEDHIRNLEQLVLFLDLKNITLVVHDWGGAIGLGFALRHKDRIRNLIILNTAAFLSPDIPKRIALLKYSIFPDLLIRRANLFCLAATQMCTVKRLSSEIQRAYLFPYKTYRDRIAIAGFVKDIPLKETDASYKTLADIQNGLRSLKVPTLIQWGAKDFCFHLGFLKEWKKIYPHAQAKEYSNAGHYILEDEFEAVAKEIKDFLR